MMASFEDFCLYVYVAVDDHYRELAPRLARSGPATAYSDRELITIALVGEAYRWDVETELRDRRAPCLSRFPHFPERSRYNRQSQPLARDLCLGCPARVTVLSHRSLEAPLASATIETQTSA